MEEDQTQCIITLTCVGEMLIVHFGSKCDCMQKEDPLLKSEETAKTSATGVWKDRTLTFPPPTHCRQPRPTFFPPFFLSFA